MGNSLSLLPAHLNHTFQTVCDTYVHNKKGRWVLCVSELNASDSDYHYDESEDKFVNVTVKNPKNSSYCVPVGSRIKVSRLTRIGTGIAILAHITISNNSTDQFCHFQTWNKSAEVDVTNFFVFQPGENLKL